LKGTSPPAVIVSSLSCLSERIPKARIECSWLSNFFATYEYGRIYGAGKEVLHLLCNDALTRPIAARDERGFLGAAHLGKPGERRELLFLRLAVDIGVNEYETLIEPRERRVSNEVPRK
jgi:hypothetical protein